MAYARVAALLGAVCAASCAAAPSPATAPPSSAQRPREESFQFDRTSWGTFRSKRFALVVGLPDGRAWRIDDHGTPWLRATHAASSSALVVRSWIEPQPPTLHGCYGRARQWDPSLPDLEQARLVDEKRGKVAGDAGQVSVGMEGAETGFVVAVAASVRKCTILVLSTQATDPEVVASRLVMFAQKVVPSLEPTTTLAPAREPFSGPRE